MWLLLLGASNYTHKVKVKLTLEQATKAQRGSRGIAHTWGPGGTPSVFLIFYVFLEEHFINLIT